MTEKKKRGFALMDKNRLREIASKGGKNVPAEKRRLSYDREFAAEVGRKGGIANGEKSKVKHGGKSK